MAVIERVVSTCCRFPGVVAVLGILLALGGAYYTKTHFEMNTDNGKLISPTVKWRQHEMRFDKRFPQTTNLIAVVIDGATPELAEQAAANLAASLSANKAEFSVVRRPDGGDFFNKNGLLFLPSNQVRATLDQIITAAPFLGPLAADPSLRGVMDTLSTALEGVSRGQAKLDQLERPIEGIDHTLSTVTGGGRAFLSWRELITGKTTTRQLTRRFLEVKPVLNFHALEPGAAASNAIRAAAVALRLTPENGVRVRLTGPVPLADEEFATLADRAALMGGAMMAAVLVTLWLAVRSVKIIACILVTLFAGLAITMAAGLFIAHVFNIISIAFVALFVGLGVDFAIQFCVRYRHERFVVHDLAKSLTCAARSVGMPLALAAAATAVGFFSFLPTSYVGVAELGMVAGIGMIVAFVLAVTLLPALLMLVKPEGEAEDVGYAFFAPIDRFICARRNLVLWTGGIAAAVCLVLVTFVRFDFNPLDLRSAKTESVSTILDLTKDPQTSPNTIDVPTPNLDAAKHKAALLARVPQVGQTITLADFVPDDQPTKLKLISDANMLLDPVINPFAVKPAPSDSEVVQSLIRAAGALRSAAGNDRSGAALAARRFAGTLQQLAHGNPALRARAADAVVPGLKTMLRQLSASLQASPVSIATMPKDMVEDWVAKDGTARIQVFPKDTTGNTAALTYFSKAVLRVAPDATGAPISIRESGITIVQAFAQAGVLSFIVICVLLLVVLRKLSHVLRTILPLALTGLLTMATTVVIGLQLNFANVIALPLLFGIGVAFNIYFVMAGRAGQSHLLQTSLTRAVIFSALTTASGFGSLWLSSHPGTASMGELLMISLFWTLVTTLFFLPALLEPEQVC